MADGFLFKSCYSKMSKIFDPDRSIDLVLNALMKKIDGEEHEN